MWPNLCLNATCSSHSLDSCRIQSGKKKKRNTKPTAVNYFRVTDVVQVFRYEPLFKGFDAVFFSVFGRNFSSLSALAEQWEWIWKISYIVLKEQNSFTEEGHTCSPLSYLKKINETNFQKCLKEEEKTMKIVISSLVLLFIATLKEVQISCYDREKWQKY